MIDVTRRILALSAVGLLLASGIAGADGKTAGQVIDDSTLSTKTKAALLEDPKALGTTLNVDVRKGTVLVAGFVDNDENRAAAIAVARKAAGTARFVDGIVVVAGGRTPGVTLDDTSTQARLKAALVDRLGQGLQFNTDVRRGEALVSGFVNSEGSKAKATEVARAVSGVTRVHNKLVVLP